MHLQYHGSRGKRASAPMAEINIVPLVDVVLVLLIIFMATTAFVKESGLNMKLPAARTTEQTPDESTDLNIALTIEGNIYVNGHPSSDVECQKVMVEHARRNPQTRVIIKGDERIPYRRIVDVMDMAKQAGLPRVSLGTRLPQT